MTNKDEAGARRAARTGTRARGAAGILALVLFTLLPGALAVLAGSSPARATPMVVTSLGDFNSAVGAAPTTVDDFSPDVANGFSITFASGVVSTAIGGRGIRGSNRVGSGFFFGVVGIDNEGFPTALTWTFPQPVIGFGIDIPTVLDLAVTIPGVDPSFHVRTELGGSSGFFGLVDTMAPFTQIQFSYGGPLENALEFVGFDNFVFAAAPAVTAVPEPASLALFALGLAGLAGLGFRRRRMR